MHSSHAVQEQNSAKDLSLLEIKDRMKSSAAQDLEARTLRVLASSPTSPISDAIFDNFIEEKDIRLQIVFAGGKASKEHAVKLNTWREARKRFGNVEMARTDIRSGAYELACFGRVAAWYGSDLSNPGLDLTDGDLLHLGSSGWENSSQLVRHTLYSIWLGASPLS